MWHPKSMFLAVFGLNKDPIVLDHFSLKGVFFALWLK